MRGVEHTRICLLVSFKKGKSDYSGLNIHAVTERVEKVITIATKPQIFGARLHN